MPIARARHTWVLVALFAAAAAWATGPYEALHLPAGIEPTLHSAPVGAIQAGSLSIHLEKTPLARLQKAFGGVLQHGGDAGSAANWLCLLTAPGGHGFVIWFISNAEMSGPAQEVTQIAVQQVTPPAPAGCSSAPAGFTVELHIPGLGSSREAITAYFGRARPGGDDLGYASSSAVKGDKEATRLQTIQYRLRDGAAVTVSVSQVTSR